MVLYRRYKGSAEEKSFNQFKQLVENAVQKKN